MHGFKRLMCVGVVGSALGCGSSVQQIIEPVAELPVGTCMQVQGTGAELTGGFEPIGLAGQQLRLDLFAPKGACVPARAEVSARVQGPDQVMMPVEVSSELMMSSGAYRVRVDFTPSAPGLFKAMAEVEPQVAKLEREVWVARQLPVVSAAVSVNEACDQAQLTAHGLMACVVKGRLSLIRNGEVLAQLPAFQARVAGDVIWVHHGATVSRWVDYGEGAPAKHPASDWVASPLGAEGSLIANESALLQLEVRPTLESPLGVGELTRFALVGEQQTTQVTQPAWDVTGVVAASHEGGGAFVGWKTANGGLGCRLSGSLLEVPTCQAVSGELVGADGFGLWVANGRKLERVSVKSEGWAIAASLSMPTGWRAQQLAGIEAIAMVNDVATADTVLLSSSEAGVELARVGPGQRIRGISAHAVLATDAASGPVTIYGR